MKKTFVISLMTALALFQTTSWAVAPKVCDPDILKKADQPGADVTRIFAELMLFEGTRVTEDRGISEVCFDEFLKRGLKIGGVPNGEPNTVDPLIVYAPTSQFAKRLVEKGADIKATGYRQESLLTRAARNFSLEEFKYWQAQMGVVLNNTTETAGILYLNALSRTSHDRQGRAIVKYLMSTGVDPFLRADSTPSGLQQAVFSFDVELVNLLLSHPNVSQKKEELNRVFYFFASQAASKELLDAKVRICKSLINAGADVDIQNPDTGLTALVNSMNISLKSDAPKLLISLGADVKKAEASLSAKPGRHSIYATGLLPIAVAHNDPELATLLIKKGAKMNSQDGATRSAMTIAASQNYPGLVRVLLDNGYPPNGNADDVFMPLSAAVDSLEILKLLLEKGADINAMPAGDEISPGTVLHYAALRGNVTTTKYLLSMGAELNKRNKNAQTPLRMALMGSCKPEYIAYLLSLPNIDLDLNSELNLLHAAAFGGQCKKETIALLVKAGIPVDGISIDGKTPLQMAVGSSFVATADALVESGANTDLVTKLDASQLQWFNPLIAKHKDHIATQAFKRWASNPKEEFNLEQFKRALRTEANQNGKLLPLPKHASPELVAYHALLKEGVETAKSSPGALTARPLDVEEMPANYYRTIVKAAQSTKASIARKFKPTAEQAKKVLKTMVADSKATNQDYEAMTWLIGAASMPFDTDTLELFNFSSEDITRDVDAMIKTKPMEYKGSPNIAVLKLGKALLTHPDSDFECREATNVKEDGPRSYAKSDAVSDILNWLGIYGDNPSADRIFVAKIVRLVLEKKKVCEQDRDFLLRAMHGWMKTAAPIQREMTCSILASVKSRPMGERSFQELLLISQSIGLRSDFNEAAWLEQLRAFAETNADASAKFGDNLNQVYIGLLRYTLGNPEGIQKSESQQIKVPATSPKPNTIVRLCRLMKKWADPKMQSEDNQALVQAGERWIKTLIADLDSPRRWPADLILDSGVIRNRTLSQEFEAAGLGADLKAVRSNCAELPTEVVKAQPVKANKSQDFDPRGRSHK